MSSVFSKNKNFFKLVYRRFFTLLLSNKGAYSYPFTYHSLFFMKIYIFPVLIILLLIGMNSCRKGPGEGGNATITGKVYEHDYNSDFTNITSSYFKGEQDVYIVYGDDQVQSDRCRTHYDGTFEFSYLLPGNYTIYTYSENPNGSSPPLVVKKTVQISSQWETVNTDTLIIYN